MNFFRRCVKLQRISFILLFFGHFYRNRIGRRRDRQDDQKGQKCLLPTNGRDRHEPESPPWVDLPQREMNTLIGLIDQSFNHSLCRRCSYKITICCCNDSVKIVPEKMFYALFKTTRRKIRGLI